MRTTGTHDTRQVYVNILDSFKNPKLCRALLDQIKHELTGPFTFMEVCGTHTVAIFQSGLRTLLPESVTHLSGPGCPVCVTHESEVAAFIDLAGRDNVIVATFGDLMRVPGPKGANLKNAQAAGARIEVVYSPHDALKLAADNPGDKVVFLGVGFETTAPTIAATIKMAKAQGLTNFHVLSFHKLVPPALRALLAESSDDPDAAGIDGFLMPGHVSLIIGLQPYQFVADEFKIPCAIGGFDPADILQALLMMIQQKNEGKPRVANAYTRAVTDEGNPKAREILYEVFQPADALWRGIGTIPDSGLVFTDAYEHFDALKALDLTIPDAPPLAGCKCGDVLRGRMQPNQCPLFAKACTPAKPVGPCMVSTEGSCAAYFKYNLEG